MLLGAVFLGVPVSGSQSPGRGRSLRSRRTRAAPPNLDPAPARWVFAPVEEDGRVVGGRDGCQAMGVTAGPAFGNRGARQCLLSKERGRFPRGVRRATSGSPACASRRAPR